MAGVVVEACPGVQGTPSDGQRQSTKRQPQLRQVDEIRLSEGIQDLPEEGWTELEGPAQPRQSGLSSELAVEVQVAEHL